MTNFEDLQQYTSNEVEANCDLCKKPMGVTDTFELGKWVFHYNCYHIISKGVESSINVLLGSEDKFEEWLNDT